LILRGRPGHRRPRAKLSSACKGHQGIGKRMASRRYCGTSIKASGQFRSFTLPKMARRGRRRWALLFRRGAMISPAIRRRSIRCSASAWPRTPRPGTCAIPLQGPLVSPRVLRAGCSALVRYDAGSVDHAQDGIRTSLLPIRNRSARPPAVLAIEFSARRGLFSPIDFLLR
jgi:hypothetical protein